MANSFLEETRTWLAPVKEKIMDHPFIIEAEKGSLPRERIGDFVANQYHIVSQDIKSLALMASRSSSKDELGFFKAVFDGDVEALPLLVDMADSFGWDATDLERYIPIPESMAYANYLTVLAQFASPGEQVIALTVNLPVWGTNCGRLSRSLREHYHVEETGFLDLFAETPEESAVDLLEVYSHMKERLRRAAWMIQFYELMFWNGVYSGGKGSRFLEEGGSPR